MLTPLPQQLDDALRDSPVVSHLIANWAKLGLPDCWLVAGAVVQTYRNAALGLPPLHGLSDVDIIYFDPDDLSEAAESRHAARIEEYFGGLGISNKT